MKKLISILNLSFLLLATVSICAAAGEVITPGSSMREASTNKVGEQCMFVRGAGHRFDRELLSVPAEGCVLKIDSWVIKIDRFFKPTEVISPDINHWKITWNALREIPLMDSKDWSLKVKIRGTRQATAVLSYKFD